MWMSARVHTSKRYNFFLRSIRLVLFARQIYSEHAEKSQHHTMSNEDIEKLWNAIMANDDRNDEDGTSSFFFLLGSLRKILNDSDTEYRIVTSSINSSYTNTKHWEARDRVALNDAVGEMPSPNMTHTHSYISGFNGKTMRSQRKMEICAKIVHNKHNNTNS